MIGFFFVHWAGLAYTEHIWWLTLELGVWKCSQRDAGVGLYLEHEALREGYTYILCTTTKNPGGKNREQLKIKHALKHSTINFATHSRGRGTQFHRL